MQQCAKCSSFESAIAIHGPAQRPFTVCSALLDALLLLVALPKRLNLDGCRTVIVAVVAQ